MTISCCFQGGLPIHINTLREIWTSPYRRTILPFSSLLAQALICKTGYILSLVYSPITKQGTQMYFFKGTLHYFSPTQPASRAR